MSGYESKSLFNITDEKVDSNDNSFDEMLSQAVDWFDGLSENEQESIIDWYNTPEQLLNSEDLELFHLYFVEINSLFFETCDDCDEIFVNTNCLSNSDWRLFQGVSYEGSQIYPYVYGHVEGDEPERGNICENCI